MIEKRLKDTKSERENGKKKVFVVIFSIQMGEEKQNGE